MQSTEFVWDLSPTVRSGIEWLALIRNPTLKAELYDLHMIEWATGPSKDERALETWLGTTVQRIIKIQCTLAVQIIQRWYRSKIVRDPITLCVLRPPIYTFRREGVALKYNLDSIVNFLRRSDNWCDPQSRIELTKEDVQLIESMANEHGLLESPNELTDLFPAKYARTHGSGTQDGHPDNPLQREGQLAFTWECQVNLYGAYARRLVITGEEDFETYRIVLFRLINTYLKATLLEVAESQPAQCALYLRQFISQFLGPQSANDHPGMPTYDPCDLRFTVNGALSMAISDITIVLTRHNDSESIEAFHRVLRDGTAKIEALKKHRKGNWNLDVISDDEKVLYTSIVEVPLPFAQNVVQNIDDYIDYDDDDDDDDYDPEEDSEDDDEENENIHERVQGESIDDPMRSVISDLNGERNLDGEERLFGRVFADSEIYTNLHLQRPATTHVLDNGVRVVFGNGDNDHSNDVWDPPTHQYDFFQESNASGENEMIRNPNVQTVEVQIPSEYLLPTRAAGDVDLSTNASLFPWYQHSHPPFNAIDSLSAREVSTVLWAWETTFQTMVMLRKSILQTVIFQTTHPQQSIVSFRYYLVPCDELREITSGEIETFTAYFNSDSFYNGIGLFCRQLVAYQQYLSATTNDMEFPCNMEIHARQFKVPLVRIRPAWNPLLGPPFSGITNEFQQDYWLVSGNNLEFFFATLGQQHQ